MAERRSNLTRIRMEPELFERFHRLTPDQKGDILEWYFKTLGLLDEQRLEEFENVLLEQYPIPGDLPS